MSRSARVKAEYGIYYIQQSSSSELPIFNNNEDRSYFLEILKRAQKKFGFKLYGYCILSPIAYHLVVDTNGSDLSSIMKSINIGYAMYRKNTHPLFKDRYKSQPLLTMEQVKDKLQAIHRSDDSVFNSFCHYDISSPLKLDWIAPLSQRKAGITVEDSCEESGGMNEGCFDCIKTMEESKNHLNRIASEGGMTVADLLKDKSCRNQLIKDFRKQSTLSLKEIGILFGGLTESSVCKILNQ